MAIQDFAVCMGFERQHVLASTGLDWASTLDIGRYNCHRE